MRPQKAHVPFALQSRDLAFLRGLFESRLMTREHASILHFDGRSEAAKKRIQKLKAAGLVIERPRHAFDPGTLYLTSRGIRTLAEASMLDGYPPSCVTALAKRTRVSPFTLRHELQVMDVKAAFHAALAKMPGLSLVEFTTWPQLIQFEVNGVAVKPDGYVHVRQVRADGSVTDHRFFLELDRSTETQERIIARCMCYLEYYRSGAFARRNGASPADLRDHPFRVLSVFDSAARRDSFVSRLASSGGSSTQLWAATFADVRDGPLGSIWTCPMSKRSREKSGGTKEDKKAAVSDRLSLIP